MASSKNKSIRVALLGYEISSLTLYSLLLERKGMTIVARELYTPPFDAGEILPTIIEKNPNIFVIGQISRFEEADEIAQQIKQFAPDTPILGSVAGKSDKQSQYLDDCLHMPILYQNLYEVVIRLTGNTKNS